jgi:hypothetical protein
LADVKIFAGPVTALSAARAIASSFITAISAVTDSPR